MQKSKQQVWFIMVHILLAILILSLIIITVYSVAKSSSTVYKIQDSKVIEVQQDSGRILKNIDLIIAETTTPTERNEFTPYMKDNYAVESITYNFTDGTSHTVSVKYTTFNELKENGKLYPNQSIYHKWDNHKELEVTYDTYTFESYDRTETKRFKVYQDMSNIEKNTEVFINPISLNTSEFAITHQTHITLDSDNINDYRTKPFWSNTNGEAYTINATVNYSWSRRSGKVTNHHSATIKYQNVNY